MSTDSDGSAHPAQPNRQAFIQAVRAAVDAPRNDSSKWNPLYKWFADELSLGDGSRGGPVIGKLITEERQIGNRCDEMAKSDPVYAVISHPPDVSSERILQAMAQRGKLPSLRVVLFLVDTEPERLVLLDD